ncbi:MFS transporter [Mobilicoccus massiliensis]|uniref:MFS transporter n=1 Tax=Mobilicoccus massiliensis TaxID=1522310 RepID=UPI0006937B68|nr:MFS transporter [Mobilicoccus massiliensis]
MSTSSEGTTGGDAADGGVRGEATASVTRAAPPPKRLVAAWAAWDWGSAAFNAVITTFVFTVYLTSSGFGDPASTSAALGLGTGLAGVCIALLAPVIGQSADRAGRPVRWLGINTAIVVVLSALMFTVRPHPDFLWWGIALLAVGHVFFEFASVNYNGMLHRVSTPATIGRVSGIGWGAGYLGGIALLLILFVGFIQPEVGWFGVTRAEGLNVRVSMLVAAAWFAVFALPVLLTLRDRPAAARGPALGVAGSYRALFRTVAGLAREHPHMLFFLLASAVFRDGLAGVFTFGGVIAQGTFSFTPGQVIVFGIAANVVAGLATILFGVLDDRIGPKSLIIGSLVAMVAAAIGIFALHDRGAGVFWVLGLALCVFVGPAQSASRSLLARLIPAGREGEIFGLYATTGRAVSFLAPLMFSAFIALGSRVDGGASQHWGILGISVVLLVGLVLLLPVRPAAARATHLPPAAV